MRMDVVNAVTDVVVVAASLPGDGATVGVAVAPRVDLVTQDDAPVPWDAAAGGLTLSLTPPGAAKPHVMPHRPLDENMNRPDSMQTKFPLSWPGFSISDSPPLRCMNSGVQLTTAFGSAAL